MATTKDIKKEIIEAVTEQMIKTNRAPWDKGLLNDFLPANYESGKNYRGINRLLLNFLGTSDTSEYMTFVQAKNAGGHVKKGAKGLPIIKWMPWNYDKHRAPMDDDDPKEIGYFIKKYTVFSVQQVEGVEPKRTITTTENKPRAEIETAIDKFFSNTKLGREEKNGTAFYSPAEHKVSVANINQYKDEDHYYSTILHEMAHSTKAALGRKQSGGFGTKVYSQEEVIAEITSAMLCQYFGIEATGWAQKIKENPDWLIKGANEAEKAYEYILEKMEIKAA